MFELDLSLRKCSVVEPSVQPQTLTEEDAMMESLFDEPASGSKRESDSTFEDEERKRLRLMIDAAFEESEPIPSHQPQPEPLSAPVPEDPQQDMKELWKNAGILREYGGIKGWLAMQRPAPSGSQGAKESDAR